jgi:hypothetical protein
VAPVVATFAMTSGASASTLGRLFNGSPADPGNGSPADPGADNTGGGSPADPGADNTGGGGGAPTDPNAGNTGGGDVQGGFNYRQPRSSALPDTR